MLRAMSTPLEKVFACAVLALGLGGCAYGELHQVLRAQVASELSCPEVAVKKKGLAYIADDEDINRYLVTGCGVTRTYTCPETTGLISYDEPVCSYVEGNTDQPEVAKMPGEGEGAMDDMSLDQGEDAEAQPAKPAAKPAKGDKHKAPAKKPAKAEEPKAPAEAPADEAEDAD
jgi:hypothetical protein